MPNTITYAYFTTIDKGNALWAYWADITANQRRFKEEYDFIPLLRKLLHITPKKDLTPSNIDASEIEDTVEVTEKAYSLLHRFTKRLKDEFFIEERKEDQVIEGKKRLGEVLNYEDSVISSMTVPQILSEVNKLKQPGPEAIKTYATFIGNNKGQITEDN